MPLAALSLRPFCGISSGTGGSFGDRELIARLVPRSIHGEYPSALGRRRKRRMSVKLEQDKKSPETVNCQAGFMAGEVEDRSEIARRDTGLETKRVRTRPAA